MARIAEGIDEDGDAARAALIQAIDRPFAPADGAFRQRQVVALLARAHFELVILELPDATRGDAIERGLLAPVVAILDREAEPVREATALTPGTDRRNVVLRDRAHRMLDDQADASALEQVDAALEAREGSLDAGDRLVVLRIGAVDADLHRVRRLLAQQLRE